MDDSACYQICVKGRVTAAWSEYFYGMEICTDPDNNTLLCGSLPDQAALHGVLNRINSLGLILLALETVPPEKDCLKGKPHVQAASLPIRYAGSLHNNKRQRIRRRSARRGQDL